MIRLSNLFIVYLLIFLCNCSAGKKTGDSFFESFQNIKTTPSVLSFSNDKLINNSGGHIQGIQVVARKDGKYAVMTGSSDSCSYCAVVRLGDRSEVVSVNRLMDRPYKHAGGFQIFKNLMAVGIEDNSAKDKSKVCIYDISAPEKPFNDPLAVIRRAGEPKRSTAGCVGITKYKDLAVVVVGDWDTKHLDFYACKFDSIRKNSFKKIYSIDTETVAKSDWIDTSWLAYQNINLFTSESGKMYLIGFGCNEKKADVADLYLLSENGSDGFNLKKLASKTFACKNGVSFSAGAGAFLDNNGKLKIISCGYHIENISNLNCFGEVF